MSLTVDLKVIPGAKHNKIMLDKSGSLVFYIKSVAQDNKANEELIKIISSKLKVAKSAIEIISGHKTRYKRILIDVPEVTLDIILAKLNIEKPELNMNIW